MSVSSPDKGRRVASRTPGKRAPWWLCQFHTASAPDPWCSLASSCIRTRLPHLPWPSHQCLQCVLPKGLSPRPQPVRTPSLDVEPTEAIQDDLILRSLNLSHLKRPLFQVRSRSQVAVVKKQTSHICRGGKGASLLNLLQWKSRHARLSGSPAPVSEL